MFKDRHSTISYTYLDFDRLRDFGDLERPRDLDLERLRLRLFELRRERLRLRERLRERERLDRLDERDLPRPVNNKKSKR